MKKSYVLSLSLLFLLGLQDIVAQPSLNADGNIAPTGKTLAVKTVSAESFDGQGAAGANIIWDFSNLATTNSHTLTFIPVTATSFAAAFPDASVAIQYEPAIKYGHYDAEYEFFNGSQTDWLYQGVVTPADVPVSYSNAQTVFNYPFEYNDLETDNFSGMYMVGTTAINQEGTTTIEADAYGSLILPYDTITDVLRVKILKEYSDEANGILFTFIEESYAWYVKDIAYPILHIFSEDFDGTTITRARYAIISQDDEEPTTVGFTQYDAVTAKIFPNPATDKVQVNYEGKSLANIRLTIYNSLGQVVATRNTTATNLTETIDVQNYTTGLYLFELQVDNKRSVQTVVIK